MKTSLRLLALSGLAVLGLSAPAYSQVMVVGAPAPMLVPAQAYYVPTTRVIVPPPPIVRTPVGPTAYVVSSPTTFVAPARTVVTTTTTRTLVPATAAYVPTSTLVPARATIYDPAPTPVGYEVIRPGRTKVVYPRRVVKYSY